ncbi:hypothetical protein GGX14DRAFT_325471, partial [Mycena pura]
SKICARCGTRSTPLWRRDPRTHKPLCNACGLYLYQRHEDRPHSLIAAERATPLPPPDQAQGGPGPVCTNCGTRTTSAWRRNKAREQVCNACGVYERTNDKTRPVELRSDRIKPRSKH